MRQYVVRPGQECKSELIEGWNLLGGWHDTINFDGCAVKPGEVSRKKWCLRCLLKTGNVKAEETWVGSLFQTRDAVDEKDFEVAIDVFLNGADMVIEEEDWSDCKGVYLGRI